LVFIDYYVDIPITYTHGIEDLGLLLLGTLATGGILHSASDSTAIFNPTVDSYKPINAPGTTSGATWAPNPIPTLVTTAPI